MEELSYLIMSLYLILGLVFGSFLNVVIYRIPNKDKLSYPASHCTSCNHKLSVYDLIPVFSWLSLRGKCRYCNDKISIQYPIVEIVSGVIFCISYALFGLQVESILFCIIALSLLAIGVIDYKYFIIPNKIILWMLPFCMIIAYLHVTSPLAIYSSPSPWEPLWGALVGAGILFAIAVLGFFLYRRKEVMGMGDVKLLIILGMLTGVTNTLLLLFYSSIISGVVSFALIISGNRKRSEFIALGPYLVLSFCLVLIQTVLV